MKVALIAPPIMDRVGGRLRPIAMDAARECPPYGIYLLASALRDAGHEVALVDLIAEGTRRLRTHAAEVAACDLVGIGATSLSWPTAIEVVGQVRRLRVDVPIVLGGIHPTMFDRYLLSAFPVDYVVRGEGERALLALCEALEGRRAIETVPNLSWRTADRRIVRNPLGPKLSPAELAAAPLPDFGAIPEGRYKGIGVESSRGCAHDCSFCSTAYRRSWRALPATAFVDRVERALRHLSRTTAQTIHVVDDEFSTSPRRCIEIAELLHRRGLRPRLVYDSRVNDLLVDGYVESMAELTWQFLVGAECGYDEGLARAGKGTTCRQLEDAAARLARHGLSERADFSFILGLPWESKAEVIRTVRFAMHLLATYGVRVLLQWYCQMPGSRLWEEARQAELVTEALYDEYGFFRNLYLLRSGIRLSPRDIWELGDLVGKLVWVASRGFPGRRMVEYAFPEPIATYLPLDALSSPDTGLTSLREVARPGAVRAAAEPRVSLE